MSTTTKTKRKDDLSNRKLHIDKRAGVLAEVPYEGNDDNLLSTVQVANWFGVSQQWLELGRSQNYGPPFKRLTPQIIRYRRDEVVEWLKQRSYACISHYEVPDYRSGNTGRRRK